MKSATTIALILHFVWSARVTGQTDCTERCFENLGCFDNCPPFQEFPIPSAPEEINTTFHLYMRDNGESGEVISEANLGSFDGSRGELKIIAHTFTEDRDTDWVQDLKNAYLDKADDNVVVIDWAAGAVPDMDRPLEMVPASNTRVVGKQTANLVRAMQGQRGLALQNVHCTGFSASSHLCGFMGKDLRAVRRITGLDPAGVLFDKAEPRIRLDKADATFVDIVHTNAIGTMPSGISRDHGHVDFWVNRGGQQPGCRDMVEPMDGVCSHYMAVDYFAESVRRSCPFTSRPCESAEAAKSGTCGTCTGDRCQSMGYRSESRPARGNFILDVNAQSPYCIS